MKKLLLSLALLLGCNSSPARSKFSPDGNTKGIVDASTPDMHIEERIENQCSVPSTSSLPTRAFLETAESVGINHYNIDARRMNQGGPTLCAFHLNYNPNLDPTIVDTFLDVYFVSEGEGIIYKNTGTGEFRRIYFSPSQFNPRGPPSSNGCLAYDFDGDGWQDLLLTGTGRGSENIVRLYRNRGVYNDGIAVGFIDVTEAVGMRMSGSGWNATAGDIDFDGDLDVVVPNLTDRAHVFIYDGEKYSEEGQSMGIGRGEAAFVGLLFDLNDDHYLDYWQGNDAGRYLLNNMWINEDDGSGRRIFVDRAREMGLDSAKGDSADDMGVDVGDWDLDGFIDLINTNYEGRSNQLYDCNNTVSGGIWCINKSFDLGFLRDNTNWGIQFDDYDNDGDLDLMWVAGISMPLRPNDKVNQTIHNQLYWNTGLHYTQHVPNDSSDVFSAPTCDISSNFCHRSYGLATFDMDGDGDIDGVVSNVNDRPFVYENVAPQGNYLDVKLYGRAPNTDAVGARVKVCIENSCCLEERVIAGGNFGTAFPARPLHFGLGNTTQGYITITWPDGSIQEPGELEANNLYVITQEP